MSPVRILKDRNRIKRLITTVFFYQPRCYFSCSDGFAEGYGHKNTDPKASAVIYPLISGIHAQRFWKVDINALCDYLMYIGFAPSRAAKEE